VITTAYSADKKTHIFPSTGIHGICIDCGEEVISKCGTIVSHHFAHKSNTTCGSQFHDHKSEWHQQWQHTISPAIPGVNVEVTIKKDASIKRADMVSHSKTIIEFQHSHLSLPERLEREAHYKNIIWVVHGSKINSKTWKHKNQNRVFFNGDDDTIYFGPSPDAISNIFGGDLIMEKSKFINFVINNSNCCNTAIQTIEMRGRNRKILQDQTLLERDDILCLNGFHSYRPLYFMKSDRITAIYYLIGEFIKIEQYHHQIVVDRLEREKKLAEIKKQMKMLAYEQLKRRRIIRETLKERRKERRKIREPLKARRKIRDPNLLQHILKIEMESNDSNFIIDRDGWIKNVERTFINLKRDYEIEQCQKINLELNQKQTQRLDKEAQERIRIDLLRVKGVNKYAAECAYERLKRLNIILEYTGEPA
jgi:hypothetical protein